jgi:hypothetical protein
VAECERVPLAPVTVTVNEPATDPVQERVEVPELVELVKTILVGDSTHVRPVEGETVVERATVPVNPFTAARVIIEVPADPTVTLTLVGLADTLKSEAAVKVKVTTAE